MTITNDLAVLAGGAGGVNTGGFMRNRIINGAMVVDQRNAGASVTIPASSVVYTVDRWYGYGSQASKFSVQRNAGSVTPPSGFSNYVGCTSLSAYSTISTDEFDLGTRIEGFNISDLAWGTASAKSVTLSFLVYSSLTGTFGGSLRNGSFNRAYPFTYTISSANTWTTVSVTIAGDTSGTWATDNGIGIVVNFSLGAGSTFSATAGSWQAGAFTSATGATSVVGTNGATFYITGVQLEVGSVATPFEREIYSNTLAKCQRYYETSFVNGTAPANGGGATTFATGATNLAFAASWSNNSNQSTSARFIVPKRAQPTMTTYGNSSGYLGYISNGSLPTSGTTFTFNSALTVTSPDAATWYVNNQVVQATLFVIAGGWAASAEL